MPLHRLTLPHVAAAIPSSALLLGLLGRYWWVFDLIVHFHHLYLLALIPPLLFLAIRAWKHALMYLPVFIYGLTLVVPYIGWGSKDAEGLKVGTLNLNSANRSTELVVEFVRGWQPDLLILEEYNWYWKKELEQLKSAYPHYREAPRQDNFGIAVYSKYPLKETQTIYPGEAGVPVIIGCLEAQGRHISLMAAHLLPPVSGFYSYLRDEQLRAMAALAARQNRPLLVAGDFNNTGWSHSFQTFLKTSGLKDPAKERGLVATWPDFIPIIQIDHILVSPELKVQALWRGPEVGSDHRPLVAEITYEERGKSGEK